MLVRDAVPKATVLFGRRAAAGCVSRLQGADSEMCSDAVPYTEYVLVFVRVSSDVEHPALTS